VTGASARLRMEVTNILQAATGHGATAQQRQGLTLVHFSAQFEPFLILKHTLYPPDTP